MRAQLRTRPSCLRATLRFKLAAKPPRFVNSNAICAALQGDFAVRFRLASGCAKALRTLLH